MKRIFIDTDIGSDIDDALALLLILNLSNQDPDINLLGVSTVYGPTWLRAIITQKILKTAGKTIPVFAGACFPLYSPYDIWVAGTEGEGVTSKDDVKAGINSFGIETNPTQALKDAVIKYPGEVTIIAFGALTNIAIAFQNEPEITKNLKEIVFMGAGIDYKHDPRVIEQLDPAKKYVYGPSYNVRCDVKGSKIVLQSGVPMRIVTNDATNRLWLEGEIIEKFQTTQIPQVKLVGKMLDVWLKYRTEIFRKPIKGTCPHDPLTIAIALNKIPYESVRGILELDEYGSTSFQLDPNSHLELIYKESSENFEEWLCQQLHPIEMR